MVKFSDGTTLECADNHIFIDKLGNQVFAKDSGGLDIRCKDGLVKVV